MKIGVNGRVALGIAGVFAALVVRSALEDVCVSTWFFQSVKLNQCPDGNLRQSVGLQAHLFRELPGGLSVWARAHGVDSRGNQLEAPVRSLEASVSLVDAAGRETPLVSEEQWDKERNGFVTHASEVKLPAVPDGDYRLRARVRSKLGTDTVEAPLALYTPARIQVLTDRPLYEPGHQVRFRAVVLRTRDLSPLDGRPGTWFVSDPSGEVVLEQRMPAGPWGVVSGEIPLDRGARTGRWAVRWVSGDASGETSFQVKPFTLPRFRVEAQATRPFWRPGDSPLVEGRVVYSSGAPVADAAVEVSWSASGPWPAPLAWLDEKAREGLPRQARTDGSGRFRLALPRVPFDLRGQAVLSAVLSATDPAGDRVRGGTSVLLAEDALSVSSVTELADGLANGFNNRVYLRATTADGRLLPGTELTVKRAWDGRDEGVRAMTDEDGVAALQLDPGLPVTVVVPAMPLRRAPRPPPVVLSDLEDLLQESREASLEDQLALERVLESLRPCARFVDPNEGSAELTLGLRVSAGGAVVDVATGRSPLGTCLAALLRTRSLPPGRERMLSLSLSVMDPGLPMFSPQEHGSFGAEPAVREALLPALLDARACLPAELSQSARLPAALAWRTRPGKREAEVSWVSVPRQGDMLSATQLSCIQSRFTRLEFNEPPGDAMGLVSFTADPVSGASEEAQPQDTTLLGYELVVSAKARGEELGSTKWVVRPASLPDRRLRASLAAGSGGSQVVVDLLRGPEFDGELPEWLTLRAGDKAISSRVVTAGSVPQASFALPAGFEGWAETSWSEVTARVYVPSRARLSLEVAPDKAAYTPGELAHLQVRTWVDGSEGPAAVGLFGVDESLSQLVSLPGADALDGLRPVPTLSSPAFGVLDGTALAMGRIRGANALAATLMRVSEVPARDAGETPASLSFQQPFDPDVELTEPFYRALTELTVQVRAWEESAPQGEKLSPARMAQLWEQALAACEKRGEGVTDAFGRRLKLSRLPSELLDLTAPRVVVVNGTRLPEDVENWSAWVAKEAR